ncbi:MAG: MFS transporter [Porphyromonadaceae bacterium]|nr:MAG: MFS transporter [Porphyromonadaceae bacterium]
MKQPLYLYTFVAALGGLLFGFDTAVINGAIPFFTQHFGLTDAMKGWAVSSALIGCVIGALAVGRPGDYFGRRFVLRVLALLFLVSAIGSGLAWNFHSFIGFRVIGGLAIGGASVLSPLYISEIAPAANRGRLAITFQLAIVVGILVAFFSDYLLLNTGNNNWRWMFVSGALPALVFFILLFRVSQSPRWLVMKGYIHQARQVLDEVNPGTDTEQLLTEIRDSVNTEVLGKAVYLFKKPYLRLVMIGIAVGMFNQFTGINIVMYYTTDIFRTAGFTTDSAILQTVIIGFTNLIFTLIAMRLIDKIGRRKMLLIGSVGMTIFLTLFAFAYITGALGSWLLVVMLIGFVAFFSSSQGAVIWVLLSEMFPNNIRARGASIGSFSHWFFNAITVFLFPTIAASFTNGKGIGYIFLFYAAATLISFFFFRKFLFETKGKRLEEMG